MSKTVFLTCYGLDDYFKPSTVTELSLTRTKLTFKMEKENHFFVFEKGDQCANSLYGQGGLNM